ncbi:MAG: hypothetical protein ACEQSK_10290 [Sphingomonadaceae bacterium]
MTATPPNTGCPFSAAAAPAEWHGAQMDFSEAMSYGDYLGLNQILEIPICR